MLQRPGKTMLFYLCVKIYRRVVYQSFPLVLAARIVWVLHSISNTANILQYNLITFFIDIALSEICVDRLNQIQFSFIPIAKLEQQKVQLLYFVFLSCMATSSNCSSENAGYHDVCCRISSAHVRSTIVVIATPQVLLLVFSGMNT